MKYAAEKGKKFWAVFFAAGSFALALLLVLPAFAAGAAKLPDSLDGWRSTPVRVTEFTLSENAENLGTWQSRVYTRSAPSASVEAHLMEGSGPGTLFIPPEDAAKERYGNGPLGFLSGYETLNVAGKRAILEHAEHTGQALVVALGEQQSLTLETKSLSREELLDFARRMAAALEGK